VTKLAKNENVNTEILEKICRALNCDISDIVEMAELPGCMDEQFAKKTPSPKE
jgi:N-acetylglucosamine kinase-like BadF-type ATPase